MINSMFIACFIGGFTGERQKCPLIGVLARTFLNITTTGVKIQQAHQSKDISEYSNYWSKNTASTPIKGHF
jgi:hypothetical protein